METTGLVGPCRGFADPDDCPFPDWMTAYLFRPGYVQDDRYRQTFQVDRNVSDAHGRNGVIVTMFSLYCTSKVLVPRYKEDRIVAMVNR